MFRFPPFRVRRLLMAATSYLLTSVTPGHASLAGFSLPAGLVFEHNFYNEFGLHASIAHDLVLKGHPRLAFSYTTSRLSAKTTAGRNGLKKDTFLFHAGWYFRPGKWIDPFCGIDAGFTRYNRENEEIFSLLDTRTGLLNVRAGCTSALLGKRIRPSIDGGVALLSLISAASSPVFPLFFGIGIDFDIAKGVLP